VVNIYILLYKNENYICKLNKSTIIKVLNKNLVPINYPNFGFSVLKFFLVTIKNYYNSCSQIITLTDDISMISTIC